MNAYEIVTSKIVEHLESGKGLKAWVRPWISGGPVNFVSKHEYRGILNQMLLGIVTVGKGYPDPYWASFRQIRQAGGSVKAGEKACQVIFAKEIKVPTVNTEEPESDQKTITQKYRVFRLCPVFNLAQTDLSPDKYRAKFQRRIDFAEYVNDAADEFIAAIPHKVQFGSPSASYSPTTDTISLPDKEAFRSHADYLATHFHELTHWTGSPIRLNRLLGRQFGTQAYAKEELVAELSSAFLSAEYGIDSEQVQHESYLKNWLTALKQDAKYIFDVAHLAKQAVEFLKQESQR